MNSCLHIRYMLDMLRFQTMSHYGCEEMIPFMSVYTIA
jgi:hypothetical protein